jgi:hypothetical protein
MDIIRLIGDCLNVGCGVRSILRALFDSATQFTHGNARAASILKILIQDAIIRQNVFVILDVFIASCDECFSEGAHGFSKEAASIEWDRFQARATGTNLYEVACELTDAFIKKVNDPTIDSTTVWFNRQMAFELHERYVKVIENDLENKDRGEENKTYYTQIYEKAKTLVAADRLRDGELSIIELARVEMTSFENSHAAYWARQTRRSDPPRVNALPGPSSLPYLPLPYVQPPSHAAPPLPHAAPPLPYVAPPRQPPPPPPLPPHTPPANPNATAGRHPYPNQPPPPRVPPPDDIHIPENFPFSKWTSANWKLIRFIPSKAIDPPVNALQNAAFASAMKLLQPADRQRSAARVAPFDHPKGTPWLADSCAFCYNRPLADANSPPDMLWKMGTGNGAHNPIICSATIRYVCASARWAPARFPSPTSSRTFSTPCCSSNVSFLHVTFPHSVSRK